MFTFNILLTYSENRKTQQQQPAATYRFALLLTGTNKMISNNINLAHFPENGK